MAKVNKDSRTRRFRLALADAETHRHIFNLRFTKAGFIVAIISIVVVFCAIIYSCIAFTPLRTFIPGYPDAHSKRAAIQNAIKIDSLENLIFRWELYSENLNRVIRGQEPIKVDSIISLSSRAANATKSSVEMQKTDSLLKSTVEKEEKYGLGTQRDERQLPIEARHFFTPLKGVVSRGYDPVIHPYIDINAPSGSVVKSVLDGTVISAGWYEDSGYSIEIQHIGGIISIYRHNDKLLKKTGDKVSAGTPIALVGDTGNLTTGDHLHFELWFNGEAQDPTQYIKF